MDYLIYSISLSIYHNNISSLYLYDIKKGMGHRIRIQGYLSMFDILSFNGIGSRKQLLLYEQLEINYKVNIQLIQMK
jgi:hypothetical protein